VGYIRFDDDPTYDHLCEITAGMNYYVFDHSAKITFDVVFLPSAPLGYVDSGGESQFVARVQFQLAL
jgi:hypothetical protein